MAPTIGNPKSRRKSSRLPLSNERKPTPQDAGELPSRAALVGRLEAQRAELLRAMSCVNRARRTLEQHTAKPPFGSAAAESPEDRAVYTERVLDALSGASDALATAYPMLERIAQALAVEEILKEHAGQPPPPAPAEKRAASDR